MAAQTNAWSGRTGRAGKVFSAGSVHHVAWNAADDEELLELRRALQAAGGRPTPIIDRQYFHSVYFREPSGVLFELATRDIEGSKAFYGGVFGWTARDTSMAGYPYVVWEHQGRTIGGMLPMIGDAWPDDQPPHWMIYFAVSDCDRSTALAHALGGRVLTSPTDFPMGRFAVLEDPQGGTFSILAGNRD